MSLAINRVHAGCVLIMWSDMFVVVPSFTRAVCYDLVVQVKGVGAKELAAALRGLVGRLIGSMHHTL